MNTYEAKEGKIGLELLSIECIFKEMLKIFQVQINYTEAFLQYQLSSINVHTVYEYVFHICLVL
jgi:hypothetical protein